MKKKLLRLTILSVTCLFNLLFAGHVIAQTPQGLTGTVLDTQGEPIIGATVVVSGTQNGDLAGIDGSYTLTNVPSNGTIEVSFIGYTTQTIPVNGQSRIDVILQEEVQLLDEVVVVGYGTMRRQNFTGSVTTTNVSDSPVANISTTNAVDLLRGISSGISLSQSSANASAGEAGYEPSIQVRGQKSINGDQNPLLVVDGVIFMGSINDIDPNIIESMSVLKDATSLAAYGSQAANGVIMITTKKGQVGKPMITFNSNVDISNPNFKPDIRDADGYIELMNDRYDYPIDADPTWMSALQRENYEAGKTTDWYEYITRTGVTQNYSLNVSGGTNEMNYLIGGSTMDQNSFVKGDEFRRNTFNARISTNINQYMTLGANLNQSFTTNSGVRPNYGSAVTLTPFGSPTLSDGVTMRRYVDGQETTVENPLWNVYNGRDSETKGSSTVIGGSFDIKAPWVKGLSYKITGSYTSGSSTEHNFTHETNFVNIALGEAGYTTAEQDKFLNEANGSIRQSSNKSWVLDNIITYSRDIGQHYINATLVYTRDSRAWGHVESTGTDFEAIGNTSLGVYGLNNATIQNISEIEDYLKTGVGYLARANYSYKNTIHLNASVRRDGSSVFGSKNKWGVFPAFGAAWTISNHDFMNGAAWLDNLKLKASWGKNGSQTLDPYQTLSWMTIGRSGGISYIYDDLIAWGQTLETLGNPILAWETTTSFNYGIELAALKNRITLEVDAYQSKTIDQIFDRAIPVMGAGITEQQATMGQVNNWGIEAVLNTQNVVQGSFSWNSGLIFSINRNKLVELYGNEEDDIPNELFLGESLGAIYGYKWIGIIQESDTEYMAVNGGEPGDAMYANLDGSADGLITGEDREILGFNKENFRMSLTNTLTYKNFTLYFLINGVFGGNGYGLAQNDMAYLSYEQYQHRNTLNHPFWTEENPSDTYPRGKFRDGERFIALQSYGHIRLQDANLSYRFDQSMLQKVGISSLSVYVSGKNLLFYAPHWYGSDPEVRNYSRAQLSRTFTLGINASF